LKQTFFWDCLGQLGRPLFVMLICNLVLRIFLLFSLLAIAFKNKKNIEIFIYPFCSELISEYPEQFEVLDDNEYE
jgi:hypothetical protein